jgi:acyl carrier protein
MITSSRCREKKINPIAAKQKINKVMASIFGINPSEIDEDTSMDTVAGWDSIKHMKLVISLEQELGVEFEDAEVLELLSFRLIEIIVLAKLSE